MNDYRQYYLLDKSVTIYQPKNGYRASTDAILLSSVVNKIKKNDKILDVGSGTGAISLCLAHRFRDLAPKITGIEIQQTLANLSNLSSKENNFNEFLEYINCDIKNKPKNIENCSFNHVITNPSY